jgi:NTP pyrophosphatase (non-canonical NTP hydrolase)
MSDPIGAIQQKIRKFRDERDWMQFHNPKDMAIAISVEANELLEHFLWKSPQEVDAALREKPNEIRSRWPISAYCYWNWRIF